MTFVASPPPAENTISPAFAAEMCCFANVAGIYAAAWSAARAQVEAERARAAAWAYVRAVAASN